MFAYVSFKAERARRSVLPLLFSLLLLPMAADAKNLYVNAATGNDATTYANNGPSNPWRTIGRAAWGSTNREARVGTEAARAGDIVLVAAGTYTTPGTGDRSVPALYTHNEGSAGNPIIFRAEGTVRLTLSGTGPTIGSFDRDYIVWDGFTIDEAQARSVSDTGPVVAWFCTGCQFLNLTIIGNGDDFGRGDNHAGIRLEQSDDILIRGNRIRNVYSATNRNNGAGIMTYSSHRLTIEHNEISECGAGVFLKGGPYRAPSGSLIRYNYIHNVGTGNYSQGTADGAAIALHAGATGTAAAPILVYQNILTNGAQAGVRIWGFDGVNPQNNPMHIKVVNNTIDGMPIGVYVDARPVPNATHLVANNVVTRATEVFAYNTQGHDPGDKTRVEFTRNLGTGQTWAIVPVENRRNLADWRSTTNQDLGSVQTDPLYVSGSDYHLTGGSPARSVGRAVFGIGGADGAVVPAGAYITGNESIGAGGVTAPGLPTAPRNLRITGGN